MPHKLKMSADLFIRGFMDIREDSLIVSRRANLDGSCTHLGGALARHPGAGTVI